VSSADVIGADTMLQQNGQPTERLVVVPKPVTDLRPNRPARFLARLESSGEIVVLSHRPLVDGARALLERGADPTTLMTMRHVGNAFDSFRPAPIGVWAGLTYDESDRDGLKRRRWMPRQLQEEAQKSTSAGVAAVIAHPDANSLPTSPRHTATTNRSGGGR
jgi:hypothetical protein